MARILKIALLSVALACVLFLIVSIVYPPGFRRTIFPQFDIIAWNVESGGSDPETILKEVNEFSSDIIALSEVSPPDLERFAHGRPSIHTESGGDDRVQIILNTDRVELLQRIELNELNDGRHRSPLVARLKTKNRGKEFLLVAVHLARGNEALRLKQAEGLVACQRR